MIISHNLNAMNAHRNMAIATTKQGNAMEKLSSGTRINRAGDDAAGLAISEKMRSQIRGLNQASRNAQDGVSMIQTAEGALSETQAIGQRMRELAIQSANGTYTDEDRKLIDQEFGQLKKEIDRIANDTDFNGSKVLNGDKSGKTIDPTGGKAANKGNSAWNFEDVGGGTANTNNNITEAKMKETFKDSTTKEEILKLGEGNFSIRVFKGNGSDTFGKDGSKLGENNVKIQLVDKSKFNNEKEYVMDEVILKGVDQNGNKTAKINLAGVKFDLKALDGLDAGKSAQYSLSHTIEKKTEGMKLQIGSSGDQSIGFDVDFMRSRELGLGGITIDNVENAQEAIERVDEAISRISIQRADLGATQNRLEHTIISTENTAENLQAAESRVRDVDMAKEMMNLTKINVLQQASQAMMSQANQAPQQVLSILR